MTSSTFSAIKTSGSGSSLTPLVNFYSKLPKGPASKVSGGGIKARYFNGKNASAAPLVWTILGIFTFGYAIDYQSK
jgi:F-type H+-transporting ATPase subunit f